jgi:hypothetical protein
MQNREGSGAYHLEGEYPVPAILPFLSGGLAGHLLFSGTNQDVCQL